MALTGIDTSEIIEHISEHDPDLKNPTVFKLGVVDSLTIAKIEDKLTTFSIDSKNPGGSTDAKISSGMREIELLRAGLRGWENFNDRDGKPIPFQTNTQRSSGSAKEVPTDKTLEYLPTIIAKELANVIYNQNKLDEGERKNSV